MLKNLEENNIFMFQNIQHDEFDLEQFKQDSTLKIKQAKQVVDKLQSNVLHYDRRISEKRAQRDGLKSMMKSFDATEEATPDKGGKKPVSFEDQMVDLQGTIGKLYTKVMHKTDQASNALVMNDPLTQLREIESQLHLMLETRDYIENHKNPEVQKRYVEAEKTVEKNRKQVRYEKKRRQEMELLIARQQKVEKRTQRASEVSKSVHLNMRHGMHRSEKPRIVKKKVEERILTQEELDYLRYVDNEGTPQPEGPSRQEQSSK